MTLREEYKLTLSENNVLRRISWPWRDRLRVFENKVLWRIFESIRDEVRRGWRKLHNDELCTLYSMPSIIKMIKSSRVRWEGHVAQMEKYMVEEGEEGQDIGGQLTLSWIIQRDRMGWYGLRVGTEPASDYIFSYGKGNTNRELSTFLVHNRIILAAKRVEPVSYR
jgi:hypothetical protein